MSLWIGLIVNLCSINFSNATLELKKFDPIAKHHEWVKQLGQEYWRPLQLKAKQMKDTYGAAPAVDGFVYKAPHGDCKNEVEVGELEEVGRIRYQYIERQPTRFVVLISHIDCQGDIAFTERFEAEGEKVTPLTLEQIRDGIRLFTLQEGESYRHQSLGIAGGRQLVSFSTRKTPTGLDSKLVVDGKTHHRVTYNQDTQENILDVYNYHLVLKFEDYCCFQSHVTELRSTAKISSRFGHVRYFVKHEGDDGFEEVKPQVLQELIVNHAIASLGFSVKSYINIFLQYHFAVSASTAAGGATDRLKSDLEDAIDFLDEDNKQDLRDFLEDFLDAVNRGEIEDNRP